MSRLVKRLVISEKKTAREMFNPEKYHMSFCHECHGLGKTVTKENLKKVCQVCGGFGLIKKQKTRFEKEVGT
ncbi:MAG TPA: hypothetical protein VLW47_08460 [Thermodesulfobacteriota bacterium]|nr:hypothetical protein [Thermodesulfobacteriota bacterium]